MRMTRDDDNNSSTAHKFEMDSSSVQQLSHQNGSGPNAGGGLGGGLGGGNGGGLNSNNINTSGGLGGQQNNNKLGGDGNHQDGNPTNGGGGVGGIVVGTNGDHNQYTMPGVLHYIQHEFSRFEMERSQWDIDRAEFQVNTNSV